MLPSTQPAVRSMHPKGEPSAHGIAPVLPSLPAGANAHHLKTLGMSHLPEFFPLEAAEIFLLHTQCAGSGCEWRLCLLLCHGGHCTPPPSPGCPQQCAAGSSLSPSYGDALGHHWALPALCTELGVPQAKGRCPRLPLHVLCSCSPAATKCAATESLLQALAMDRNLVTLTELSTVWFSVCAFMLQLLNSSVGMSMGWQVQHLPHASLGAFQLTLDWAGQVCVLAQGWLCGSGVFAQVFATVWFCAGDVVCLLAKLHGWFSAPIWASPS